MQHILSKIRAAAEQYDMISENDHISVGISGGKDSVLLLAAMSELRRFYPRRFTLSAITLDMRFGGKPGNFAPIAELCDRLDVEYKLVPTDIYEVVFVSRREKNPCSLCARLRRGLLHDTAKAMGVTKLALGHHMEDAVQTFYMNLLKGGNIDCFAPVTYMSRKDIHVIRPMVFVHESDVVRVCARENLPIVKSRCPADKTTERERTKLLLDGLNKDYPGIIEKTLGAMQRAGINGW